MATQVTPKLDVLDTLTVPKRGQADAGHAATALEACPDDGGLVLVVGEVRIELPPSIAVGIRHLLGTALGEASRGHTVVLATTPDEQVSTGVAAEMLGISRTHAVTLMNHGVIPSQKVRDGDRSHRRVRLSDIAAYRQQREAAAAALIGLEQLSAEFDLDALDNTPPGVPVPAAAHADTAG